MNDPEGGIMSVTDTMTLTLLVTGSLSLYLLIQAAVDLYRNGFHDDKDR